MHLTFEEYDKLVRSGMFWEWFPVCTGFYEEDRKYLEEYFSKYPQTLKESLE